MKNEQLLEDFKKSHPELMELNPQVFVNEIVEKYDFEKDKAIKLDPPEIKISVKHPFIFDNRLISEKFNGISVDNTTVGKFPEEFPSENAELPIEEWFSLEHYLKFVENNLSIIRKELNKPSLTIKEALDALSGSIEKHLKWCIDLRLDRIDQEKDNIIFFHKLLYKIRQAFFLSDVYKKYGKNNWWYSVTSTRFIDNVPLIVGFNPGVEKKWVEAGNHYHPQTEYPFSGFLGLYEEPGSMKVLVDRFFEYFPSGNFGTQINFCFFRTDVENKITRHDLQLCFPIFEELLDYLEPSVIINFSRRAHGYFVENYDTDIETKKIPSGRKTCFASRGKIILNNKPIDYYNLPHPSYEKYIPNAVKQAWEYCF